MPTLPCPHCQEQIEGVLAQEQHDQIVAEKVAEKAAEADALRAELVEAAAREATYQAREACHAAGLHDPEGVDLAILLYNALPEDGRPSIAEWLTDRAKLPKGLLVYFEVTPAPATTAAEVEEAVEEAAEVVEEVAADVAGLPNANNGATAGNAPVTSGLSEEAIARMSLDEYARHREAILSSYSRPA